MAAGALGACASADAYGDRSEEATASSQNMLSAITGVLWMPSPNSGQTVIPVCFKNGTSAQKTFVRTTVENGWEAIRGAQPYGVDFTGWGTCAASPPPLTIPIQFSNEFPLSYVDQMGRPIRLMSLHPMHVLGSNGAAILHEFGHALGFPHEFNRADYDDVHPHCPEFEPNGTFPNLGLFPPDRASIMNYQSCGAGNVLTARDIVSFAMLYGPLDISFSHTFAIRHDPSMLFAQGNNLGVTHGKFKFEKVSGSASTTTLAFGDSVRIRTLSNPIFYLKANGNGSLVTQTTTTSASTTWVVAGSGTSATVKVNDRILFRANDQSYLGRDTSNHLTTTSLGAIWRIMDLGSAIDL
jgi:hypothetical protein